MYNLTTLSTNPKPQVHRSYIRLIEHMISLASCKNSNIHVTRNEGLTPSVLEFREKYLISILFPIDPTTVKSTMVIDLKHIVRCMAVDVDLNAAKMEQESFMTDTQISGTKMNGEMRNLVAWEADGGEHDVSLDLGGASESNGWRAEDMFKANEDQYGVTSSFKDNLEGYTLQLSTDRDSDKYR